MSSGCPDVGTQGDVPFAYRTLIPLVLKDLQPSGTLYESVTISERQECAASSLCRLVRTKCTYLLPTLLSVTLGW